MQDTKDTHLVILGVLLVLASLLVNTSALV